VAIKYTETVKCVCDKIVKFDDVILASKLLDKWDLRSRTELPYCKSCDLGKLIAKNWLSRNINPEEEAEPEVMWKGESRTFCTCCGSIFSSKVVVKEATKSDNVWRVGAPKELGDYWVVLSTQKNLPVRGEVFVKGDQEFIKVGGLEARLGQMDGAILYHCTFVLPEVPETIDSKEG